MKSESKAIPNWLNDVQIDSFEKKDIDLKAAADVTCSGCTCSSSD